MEHNQYRFIKCKYCFLKVWKLCKPKDNNYNTLRFDKLLVCLARSPSSDWKYARQDLYTCVKMCVRIEFLENLNKMKLTWFLVHAKWRHLFKTLLVHNVPFCQYKLSTEVDSTREHWKLLVTRKTYRIDRSFVICQKMVFELGIYIIQ